MLTITLDDALAARVEAAISQAKIPDVNTFATAVISEALAKLEPSPNGTAENGTKNGTASAAFVQSEGGKPIDQFFDEQRIKHGFPADWGTKEVVLTDADWQKIDSAFADTK